MIGTLLNGRFALEKELGRGGMGAVYRATDTVLGRRVAIKVLKELTGEEVGRRIRLEAQILARLLHNHIVRLYDFGESAGLFYLVMEEVDGVAFARRWKKVGLAERLAVLAQTAEALDYAHRQGIIHRDVKPANILLTAGDQAKLSDFGLSLIAGEAQESGVVRGTPQYMSPEQARGQPIDHRTDLYALGVILYECATGQPPFCGDPRSIMLQHVGAEPDPPRARNPDVPDAVADLIARLLAKDPSARPDSGREVAEALAALAEAERRRHEVPTPRTAEAWPPPVAVPAAAPPAATSGAPVAAASRGTSAARARARGIFEAVVAEPVPLTPEERYLYGHYLAYLLGGSRRRGLLGRRPLDRLNSDRARLLLAMAALGDEATGVTLGQAAELLDERPEVRPWLSPVVVARYLAARATPAKRKRFRTLRERLREASDYAAAHLTDARGVLNPGLMPQVTSDLWRLAPRDVAVDAALVARWNRLAEAWRGDEPFRRAVLHYATTTPADDPAGAALWPEVVHPLIERALWQRRRRSPTEALWDALLARLHLLDPGIRMDRALGRVVPAPVVAQLDRSLDAFVDEPVLGMEEGSSASRPEPPTLVAGASLVASLHEAGAAEAGPRGVRLCHPDPLRMTLGELRDLWRQSVAALRDPKLAPGHRPLPPTPYRLTVVASVRSKAAGQVAIQGMPNKQVELIVPSFVAAGSNTSPILAVWPYDDHSLVITHLDNLRQRRYICWDAPTGRQANFTDPAKLNRHLLDLGLPSPDALDDALSKRYRPRGVG